MTGIVLEEGAFGRNLGAAFHIEHAPSIISRTVGNSIVALTELRVDVSRCLQTTPIPEEDAFLISLYLSDMPRVQVWEGGRAASAQSVGAWQTMIHDLRRQSKMVLESPLHSMNFYIPRQAFDEAAEACESKKVGDLTYEIGVGISDQTISNLMRILMSVLWQPEDCRGRLFDHVSAALVTYVAQAYGGMTPYSRAKRGGLAPWQQRRVLDIIASRTDGSLTVGDLASECRISHRHFCRAFRHSMGIAPHLYMQNSRIERAKAMLAETQIRLGEVGLACGFADQSHFTRVFAQLAGMTPGAWRKNACPADLRI